MGTHILQWPYKETLPKTPMAHHSGPFEAKWLKIPALLSPSVQAHPCATWVFLLSLWLQTLRTPCKRKHEEAAGRLVNRAQICSLILLLLCSRSSWLCCLNTPCDLYLFPYSSPDSTSHFPKKCSHPHKHTNLTPQKQDSLLLLRISMALLWTKCFTILISLIGIHLAHHQMPCHKNQTVL